jgi:hypothetical protein
MRSRRPTFARCCRCGNSPDCSAPTNGTWSAGTRVAEVEADQPQRAVRWGILAFERADLHICWSITLDGTSARNLERRVLDALNAHDLWNRQR